MGPGAPVKLLPPASVCGAMKLPSRAFVAPGARTPRRRCYRACATCWS